MNALFLALIVLFGFVVSSVVHAKHSEIDWKVDDAYSGLLVAAINRLCFSVAIENHTDKNKIDAEILENTSMGIIENFKYPDSAKFRNERVIQMKYPWKDNKTGEVTEVDGVCMCGEVNGKNSYGAYTRYRSYTGSSTSVTKQNSDYSAIFPFLRLHYCLEGS